MLLLAVTLIALATLFSLTTVALSVADQVRNPWRAAAALAVLFAVGLALLLE